MLSSNLSTIPGADAMCGVSFTVNAGERVD